MFASHVRRWLIIAALLVLAPAAALGGAPLGEPDPPDEFGLYPVGTTVFQLTDGARDDRTLDVRAWYPAKAGSGVGEHSFYLAMDIGVAVVGTTSTIAYDDVPVSEAGPFPLIVFSHGATSLNVQSTLLLETLASHGFVVVAPNHTGDTTIDMMKGTALPPEVIAPARPADVSFVIDEMLARNGTAGDLFQGLIIADRIGLTGHSFGGFTTLVSASGIERDGMVAEPDPRPQAFMPISVAGSAEISDERLAAVSKPFLFLCGTEDQMTPIDPETTRPWGLLGSPERYRVDVTGATHVHFANVCEMGDALIAAGLPQSSWDAIGAGQLIDLYDRTCTADSLPLAAAQRIQNLYAVSFFSLHLAGDQRYAKFLTERYAAENLAEVTFYTTVPAPDDDGGSRCGIGAELLALAPLLAARRRRRDA